MKTKLMISSIIKQTKFKDTWGKLSCLAHKVYESMDGKVA